MVPSDGREIVFAGAGMLWGATTFYRELHLWRAAPKKGPASGLIAGFLLILGCGAYLAWSIRDSFR
jgi:hypothetical protein